MRVIVDRFHWITGQKRGGVFDADRYPEMDNKRSESGESMNALIERAKTFMQYLSCPNFVCFLRVRFAVRNYVSLLRDRGVYAEDSDIATVFESFRHEVRCKDCHL